MQKIKMFFPIFLAVILGSTLGIMMFKQYKPKVESVFAETVSLYFLQQGVYSSVESMQENTKTLDYYIYKVENDKYYVYAAITKSLENANKLAGFLKENGNTIYIKEYPCNNQKFLESLNQYDEMLSKTSDSKSGLVIAKQVVSLYEELVDGEHKN